MSRVKDLIAGHDRNEVLCLTQVDDIMCPSRDHMYCLDLIPGDLKLYSLTRINIPLLNQSVACHNDEKLPLEVMPVLAFGDSRSADIDGNLPAFG